MHARWNQKVVSELVAGAQQALVTAGVGKENIIVQDVPGSFELPWAVEKIGRSAKSIDAIIAVGVLIKGETMHFEYIADATSHALMRVQSTIDTPVIFGLLTVLTEQQALARAGLILDSHNHGEDWGKAAVELGRKSKIWSQDSYL